VVRVIPKRAAHVVRWERVRVCGPRVEEPPVSDSWGQLSRVRPVAGGVQVYEEPAVTSVKMESPGATPSMCNPCVCKLVTEMALYSLWSEFVENPSDSREFVSVRVKVVPGETRSVGPTMSPLKARVFWVTVGPTYAYSSRVSAKEVPVCTDGNSMAPPVDDVVTPRRGTAIVHSSIVADCGADEPKRTAPKAGPCSPCTHPSQFESYQI
jgi:hypothetical protein